MFNWLFKNRSTKRTGEVSLVRSSAYWDAAGAGSRLSGWTSPSTAFANIVSPVMLRERARDSFRNNGWTRRAVELLATDAIGAGGIKPMFRGAGKKLAQRAWESWVDVADLAGRFDLYGFEQQVVRAVAVDGEALVRILPAPGVPVPIQLQQLSPEFLDSSIVNDRTINGVEYDADGRRAFYHVFTKHPAMAPNMKSVRVPAAEVCHIFRPDQPGQERGISMLAPALVALRELQEYLEAGLVKQKVSALHGGFIRTMDGSVPLTQNASGDVVWEPGTLSVLKPGQEIEFSEPPDVGTQFDPFVRAQLRLIASAIGVPYELLTGDLSGVTFASGRHALLAYRRVLESIQHHLIVFQLLRPVLRAWARFAVAVGVLPGSPEEYTAGVRWIGPVLQALDPKAETSANIAKVRAGFTPRSEIIAMDGWDAEDIDDEFSTERAREKSKGLVFDTNPEVTTLQGQAQDVTTE